VAARVIARAIKPSSPGAVAQSWEFGAGLRPAGRRGSLPLGGAVACQVRVLPRRSRGRRPRPPWACRRKWAPAVWPSGAGTGRMEGGLPVSPGPLWDASPY